MLDGDLQQWNVPERWTHAMSDMRAEPETRRVLVVGEALVDIVATPAGTTEHVGGSPLNVAVGLAKLGVPVRLGTWLGRDAHGREILDFLGENGVGLTDESLGAGHTSTARATIGPSGDASYDFDLDWNFVPPTHRAGAHIHTGSIGAVLGEGGAAVRRYIAAQREYCTISYDPNWRDGILTDHDEALRGVEEMVGLSDVVKASTEDLAAMYELDKVDDDLVADIVSGWLSRGPALVVVTDGANGFSAFTRADHVSYPACEADVVDTVGAGDAFMAGLLGRLGQAGFVGGPTAREMLRTARVDDLEHPLIIAAAAAALAVSRPGASFPTQEELSGLVGDLLDADQSGER